MKRVFLLMVVSGLLVTLGLAQTPDAGSNTDQANVKGCLGGSDGNYTVAEDGNRQILKITSSSVDLKPHLGHDVNLIGHKASGAASSGAADNSFAVTELNMISDHCAAAAVAPVATASPSSETVIPPAAAATAPAATTSSPSSETAQHTRCAVCHNTRCDSQPVFDCQRTRCGRRSTDGTVSASSQSLGDKNRSRRYSRCDCQPVLGSGHPNRRGHHNTRCQCQRVLGDCQPTCRSRHYTRRHS